MYWYVCCAYMYSSLTSIANAAVDASALKEFNLCFNKYERSKFKPGRLNLPAMTEAAVLICAANSYFRIGMYQDYVIMVKRSLRKFRQCKRCLTISAIVYLIHNLLIYYDVLTYIGRVKQVEINIIRWLYFGFMWCFF